MTCYTHYHRNLKSLWVALALIGASLWLISPAHAATFNVKTYGATGDGTTDDSLAISNAIATANAAPGNNTVLFPTGTYVIGSQRPQLAPRGVTLQGAANATINMTDPNAQIEINAENTAVNNLTISNTGSNKNSGVLVNTTKKCTIENSIFYGWVGAVELNASTDITIQQNSFYMPKSQTGVFLQAASSASITSNKFTSQSAGYGYGIYCDESADTVVATNNKFTSLGYGVYWKGIDKGSLQATSNDFASCYYGFDCSYVNELNLNANTINSSTYAMYLIDNYSVTITGNNIDSPVYYGIYANSTDFLPVTISKNVISNVGGLFYGMYLLNHANVSNNTITSSQGGYSGIYCNDYFSPNQSQMEITNNKISGFQYGVYSYYTAKTVASNNTISDIKYSGIYSYGDASLTANANTLKNCGKLPGAYAVIYAAPPTILLPGEEFVITNNTYSGNSTANLSYFCYVDTSHRSDIKMSGNKNNAMLPNYPFNN